MGRNGLVSGDIWMGREHVGNGAIMVKQAKTGVVLTIPLLPELQAVLEDSPKDHLTYLTTKDGRPFTAAGFGNWFRTCCTDAGLSSCSAHGLRDAAARRLAEVGCTSDRIAAIAGHRTLREVKRYTRAAEQKRMALDAMARWQYGGQGTSPEQNCRTQKPGSAKT